MTILTSNFFPAKRHEHGRRIIDDTIDEPEISGVGRSRSNSIISEDGGGYLSPLTDDSHLHKIRLRAEPTRTPEVQALFHDKNEVGESLCSLFVPVAQEIK